MKLKLYAVRVIATGKIVPDSFSPTKDAAKILRDTLGKNSHCVTYGPDHRHFRR